MSTGWLRMKGLTFARRYLNIIRCVSLLEKTPHKDPKQARGGGGGGGDHLARSSLNVHGCVCVCVCVYFFPHVVPMASFICPFACVCVCITCKNTLAQEPLFLFLSF